MLLFGAEVEAVRLTRVNTVVCVQLVFQAELFWTVFALVGFFSSAVSSRLCFVLLCVSSSAELTSC